MTRIDILASERHFLDHLAPVARALGDQLGDVVVPDRHHGRASSRDIHAHAVALGLDPIEDLGAEDRPVLTAALGDCRWAARLRERTRVALLEHGSGQSFGGDPSSAFNGSYPGGSNRPASLFIAPNGHAAGRDAAAYPAAATAVVGCPKLDTLPERSTLGSGRPVVAVSFHWDCTAVPETRSGWKEFRQHLMPLVNRYRVLGHGHPRIFDELEPEYLRLGIEPVRDFRDVLAQAHCYVNEGSSTLFEAAAAGIPVVPLEPSFFRLNVPHGLRFWDAAEVGPRVRSRGSWDWKVAKRLMAAIDLALSDPPELRARREAAVDIVYAHRSGASERAAAAIVEWAERRVPVAA